MSYESALKTYTEEFNRLLAIDVDPAEAAVQAHKFTGVRELMDTGRPMRWTFAGKPRLIGNVVSISPARSETHVRPDGQWGVPGSFPADEDTKRI